MDEILTKHLEALKNDAPEVYRVITAVLGQVASPTPPAPHPDDAAVDRFAIALKFKLAQKRNQGYGGWDDPEQCSDDHLQTLLHEHLAKGDPVDVGNFAMMLWNRGGRTTPPAQEDEPYGYLYESDDGHYFDYVKLKDEHFKNDTEVPLYTRPADDKLRKAAEKFFAEYDDEAPDTDSVLSSLENLRAALAGK